MAVQELGGMAGCVYLIVRVLMFPVKWILIRVRRSLA
jgi:hypothetical protein